MDQVLSHAIAGFNGQCYSALEAALAHGPPSADALAGLVVLLEVGDSQAQIAASWLLLKCLEHGYPLLPNERRRIIRVLADRARPWEVRFKLCSAVPSLRTPPDVAETAAAALEDLTEDPHRRVRLAAIEALDALARRFPPLTGRVHAVIHGAEADSAPSVRARARLLARRRLGRP